MWKWFRKQYADIKGNVKYAAVVALWWAVVWAVKKLLQYIPHIQGWVTWAVLLCLSGAAFLWILKSLSRSPEASQQRAASGSIPPVSSLAPRTPLTTVFNPAEYLRLAYYSPITAEAEKNVKAGVENSYKPQEREAVLMKIIGLGLVSYFHDITWAYIFKSQLLLLEELNRRLMSIADARPFYEKAVREYPKIYGNYSFDQWLNYMKERQLLLRHPSEMLEITHGGRDLLRYLAHWGRDIQTKSG